MYKLICAKTLNDNPQRGEFERMHCYRRTAGCAAVDDDASNNDDDKRRHSQPPRVQLKGQILCILLKII